MSTWEGGWPPTVLCCLKEKCIKLVLAELALLGLSVMSWPGGNRACLLASFPWSRGLNGGGWDDWMDGGWRGSKEEEEPASVCPGTSLRTHTLADPQQQIKGVT